MIETGKPIAEVTRDLGVHDGSWELDDRITGSILSQTTTRRRWSVSA